MRFMALIYSCFLFAQTAVAIPLDDISNSMLVRLEAAELVAEAKYAAGWPVEGLVREAAVIEKVVGFAEQYHVDAGLAHQFFSGADGRQ